MPDRSNQPLPSRRVWLKVTGIMKTVLSISSQVVYGTVGNSAAIPAMQSLGINVTGLATTILSAHPGFGPPRGGAPDEAMFADILAEVEKRGWLAGVSGILTGYFASRAQIEVVAALIKRLKTANRELIYFCDPVLGDDHTGLYVPEDIAGAIKTELLPLADILSPNRFELNWLGGMKINTVERGISAARAIGCGGVLVSSLPSGEDRLVTAHVAGAECFQVETRLRDDVAHGTGDLLAGLFLAHVVRGRKPQMALTMSMEKLEKVLDHSAGRDVLDLTCL